MFKGKVWKKALVISLAAATLLSWGSAEAKKQAEKPLEFPVGVMQAAKQEQYSVGVYYMQPCKIEPAGVTLPVKKSDFHLKVSVVSDVDAAYGVGLEERIPGLHVSYKLIKQETGQAIEGVLLPLEDEKGAYYGTNVKVFGGGTYKCIFEFAREPQAGDGEVVKVEQLTWIFKYVPFKKWK